MDVLNDIVNYIYAIFNTSNYGSLLSHCLLVFSKLWYLMYYTLNNMFATISDIFLRANLTHIHNFCDEGITISEFCLRNSYEGPKIYEILQNITQHVYELPVYVQIKLSYMIYTFIIMYIILLLFIARTKYIVNKNKIVNEPIQINTFCLVCPIIVCCHLLFEIFKGLLNNELNYSMNGRNIASYFFILVLMDVWSKNINHNTFPSCEEILKEHIIVPVSLLYFIFWNKINSVYMITCIITVLLSQFVSLKSYSSYTMVFSNVINLFTAIYSYFYIEQYVSYFVFIHSSIILICTYFKNYDEKQVSTLQPDNHHIEEQISQYKFIKNEKIKEKID